MPRWRRPVSRPTTAVPGGLSSLAAVLPPLKLPSQTSTAVNRPYSPALPSGPDRTARCGPARLWQQGLGSEWVNGCGRGALSTGGHGREQAAGKRPPCGLQPPAVACGEENCPRREYSCASRPPEADFACLQSPDPSPYSSGTTRICAPRSGTHFLGLILSRTAVRPARDKINL